MILFKISCQLAILFKRQTMKGDFIKYKSLDLDSDSIIERSEELYQLMDQRRSIRYFSDQDIPKEVIANLLKIASSAPSGAHKQPWTFCAVSSKDLKAKIRAAAEKEEYENYNGRMSEDWIKDLEPFDTNWEKEFLETVPWLIIVFKKAYELDTEGQKLKNYYVNESVGIATGFLLAAIHELGLVSLTHTPSPMNFLEKLLDRPSNERAYMLIPVGYPTDDAVVPDLKRKELEDIALFLEDKE